MSRKVSKGRSRTRRSNSCKPATSVEKIVKNLATVEEVEAAMEDRKVRRERKQRERAETRRRLREEWEAEQREILASRGIPISVMGAFRPHVVGATFAERMENEKQQFEKFIQQDAEKQADRAVAAMHQTPAWLAQAERNAEESWKRISRISQAPITGQSFPYMMEDSPEEFERVKHIAWEEK